MPPDKALNVLVLLSILLIVKIGCVGMAILFRMLWPEFQQRAFDAYRARPWRCTVLGGLNLGGGFVLAAFLFATQVLAGLGLIVLAGMISAAAVAYSLVYIDLGMRLEGAVEDGQIRPHSIAIGGAAAEAAFLTPVLGQLLSAAALLRGVGAVATALLSRKRAVPQVLPRVE